ncbi:MAG: hypothetical protein ACREVX_02080 [Clostridium sp.]|uniref:hypothetical protein n=1 Tax=Clostridium sp. TaxID=1506 RepID=UPI003D6CEB7D
MKTLILFGSARGYGHTKDMINTIDRLQVYWAGSLRKDHVKEGSKKGIALMCGGVPSFPRQFLAGKIILTGVLGDLGADCMGIVTAFDTDNSPVSENEKVKSQIKGIANKLNENNK